MYETFRITLIFMLIIIVHIFAGIYYHNIYFVINFLVAIGIIIIIVSVGALYNIKLCEASARK